MTQLEIKKEYKQYMLDKIQKGYKPMNFDKYLEARKNVRV